MICRKGEYELDLCFILGGSVNLVDRFGEDDQVLVAPLGTGNLYGELGAIGGLPRTLDVIAREDAEIFYVPRHALKYLEINIRAREILAHRYRERAVRVTAADIELFHGVPSSFVDELIPKCEILRYELRGIPLVTQGEPGDALYIVRDGFVQVVREEGDFERDADRTMNERLRIQCQVRACASIQSADAFARDRHLAQSSKSCSAS